MLRLRSVYLAVVCGLPLALLLLGLFVGAGRTQAQPALQGTPVASKPEGPETIFSPVPGPAQSGLVPEDVAAPQVGTQYWHVPGTAFVPLYSGTTYNYGGGGCEYLSPGNPFLNYPVTLPYNTTLNQLRIYFIDTSTADGMMRLVRYTDGLTFTYIVTATTSGNTGWGTTTVNFSHTLDYANYSYVLQWYPTTADLTMELCGARIGYVPPGVFGLALPVVTK